MKLVFASNNKHKIQEIKQLLPETFEVVSLEDIGCTEDIPETADTIEGNAILKADYVTQNYGLPCFADDSGLEVDTLNGAPGVYSARYAGKQKNDEDNIQKLLNELQNHSNRKAQFKTVIALNLNGKQHLFEGIIKGEITTGKRGTNGFGYDPVFVAENSDKTFAELSSEEKNNVSHRAKAMKELVGFFELNKLKEDTIELKKRMYNYESLLKSIIEIQTIEQNKNSSTATGFLIKRDDKIFVITNKHVIGDFSFAPNFPIYDTIKLALRTKTNSIEYLDIPLINANGTLLDNVKIHPRNFIDIAIIEISELVKNTWNNYDIETFEYRQLITFNSFEDFGISTGSPIIISGYPYGIKMEKNYPISSKLTLEPPITNDDFLKFAANTPEKTKLLVNSSAFKASGNAFKGMSGGPITILAEDYSKLKELRYAVIGIFSVGTIANEKDNNHYKSAFSFKTDFIIETLKLFT